MKSNSLIFAILTFVCNFLSFWFSDVLFNRIFILGILPQMISVVMLIAALCISVVLVIRNASRKSHIAALVISVVTVLMVLFFPFRMAKVSLEFPFLKESRLQVVEMVENGSIQADAYGNAALPQGYRHLSSDGSIHVAQNEDGQIVSFWVFRGMLSGSVELIYTSLDPAVIYEYELGYTVEEIKEMGEHWYLVTTGD